MAAQGPLFPVTTTDDAGGSFSWANVTGVNAVYASDTKVASSAGNTAGFTAHNYIKSVAFGFTIPGTATIDGIVVEILRDASLNDASNQVKDSNLHLLKAGVETGDEKASATVWLHGAGNPNTDYVLASYGSSSDLWGTTWTPAEVNGSTFGMRFRPQSKTNGASISTDIDYFRITVYYTDSATTSTSTTSTSSSTSTTSTSTSKTTSTTTTSTSTSRTTSTSTTSTSSSTSTSRTTSTTTTSTSSSTSTSTTSTSSSTSTSTTSTSTSTSTSRTTSTSTTVSLTTSTTTTSTSTTSSTSTSTTVSVTTSTTITYSQYFEVEGVI